MSTLRVTTLATQAGVEVYTAKAWVNFNGTGVVAIRASGNVSSITDFGTGGYGVNFTNAFADTNYTKNVSCSFIYTSAHSIVNTDVDLAGAESAPTTTSFRFVCSTNVSGTGDPKYCSVSVFR